MSNETEHFIGIDWGGRERAVGVLVKVEGNTAGVLQEFELDAREVRRLKELDAPKVVQAIVSAQFNNQA